MNQFRARWPDRGGFILAVVGVSLGMGVVHQVPVAINGVQLLIWMMALATLVIPALVLELAIGVIFQGALSESLRKSDKRLEVIGWLSAGVAFIALVAAGTVVGDIGVSGYESLIAMIADQPLPWAVQPGTTTPPHHSVGSVLIAISAVMAFIDLRLWRGAPSIARTARLAVPAGLIALMVLVTALSSRPGAIDGVARWLAPGADGWAGLWSLNSWGQAYAYALSTWMLGLGVYAAFGSYLNRSSDVTGITGVAVLAAGMCQLLLMLTVSIASGLTGAGGPAAPAGSTVPGAIASLGAPAWVRGALGTLWFSALLAFAMPALLALAEAVVAPIADKFRVPRERVVAGVCLAAFFGAALVAVQHGHAWQVDGDCLMLACAGVLTALLALSTWWRVDLDALQRHLNAYSAFRVGLGWRALVGVLVPLGAAAVALEQLALRFGEAAPDRPLAAGGLHALAACTILAVLVSTALVVTRLPGRGA
jgi:NSS family neurotransmitter:Na+ symporter